MTKKNEKGFALVLAIVLLLAMSLMGGGLILVSSGDHKGNTSSDNYQQTFYVAETALLEAEKYLLNKLQGTPISETTRADDGKMPQNTTDDLSDFDNDRACVRSFIDYDRDGLDNTNNSADDYVVVQKTGLNFGDLLRDVALVDPLTGDDTSGEQEYLNSFEYEYFIVRIGEAPYEGFGMSIKKGSTDSELDGVAYRVYGCGIFIGSGGIFVKDKIIIPLESVVILPGMS